MTQTSVRCTSILVLKQYCRRWSHARSKGRLLHPIAKRIEALVSAARTAVG